MEDSKAIISTQRRDNTALVLEPELAEAVRRVIAAAESENTRRAYATQFAKFEAWCARRRTSALPATPAVVAVYLTDLAATGADPGKSAKGAKVATVGLALSAISAAHRTAGLGLDTKAREILEAELPGVFVCASAEIVPELGTVVAVGNSVSRVVRHFQGGFAVMFVEPQRRDSVEAMVIHE